MRWSGWESPGDRLPGLRDVAEATGVNVNTVRTVYQRLEREGLIDSQQGSGTFVVEAMIGTFVPPDGKLLVLVNGAYGKRVRARR